MTVPDRSGNSLEARLRALTPARVGLGRTGDSLPTAELLRFQLAHARARDAVHHALDLRSLATDFETLHPAILVESAAPDRETYLRRPDLGRKVHASVKIDRGDFDAAIVIADGLSAIAVERHAKAVIENLLPRLSDWRLAPFFIVSRGRVAIGDEIGERCGARLAAVLIGERPGLSSPDSLGIYLTHSPRPGRTDAERNCISNIHGEGLHPSAAAARLATLFVASRRLGLSGVDLKEDAAAAIEGNRG